MSQLELEFGLHILCARTEPQEIVQGLFLGSYACSHEIKKLKGLKISHILSEFISKSIENVDDLAEYNLFEHFEECCNWIDEALKNGNCLVHCLHGVSRSAAVVIAFLIKYQKMKLDEAFKLCKEKRPVVNPNSGFMKQLEKWEMRVHCPQDIQLFTLSKKKKEK